MSLQSPLQRQRNVVMALRQLEALLREVDARLCEVECLRVVAVAEVGLRQDRWGESRRTIIEKRTKTTCETTWKVRIKTKTKIKIIKMNRIRINRPIKVGAVEVKTMRRIMTMEEVEAAAERTVPTTTAAVVVEALVAAVVEAVEDREGMMMAQGEKTRVQVSNRAIETF